MKKVVLDNGLSILFQHKPGASVVVQVMVGVGSNHETPKERGISHFLEHILFEGTKTRPTNLEISNEIEKIGGEFNAYTTSERTCFYIKVLKKHFKIAVDVLADIMHNSTFLDKHIQKEKNIVLKEIDMVHDEPRYFQWILLQENMFKKHPCRFPTYGDRNVIQNLTKQKVLDYFNKYYSPKNMVISVVGDVKGWKEEIAAQFSLQGKKVVKKNVSQLPSNKNFIKKVKKDVTNTYTVIGFKTVPRRHKDAYTLEVINGILGRGQSGRMFTEIRSKRGLAYDVGTQNVGEVSFGYFAVYATIDRKNVALVRKVILKEMKKLAEISEEHLKEAKDFIEGDYLLELEDSQKVADQLLFWENVKSARLMKSFLGEIKKVTRADVKRVVNRYFNIYTQIVLEGKS